MKSEQILTLRLVINSESNSEESQLSEYGVRNFSKKINKILSQKQIYEGFCVKCFKVLLTHVRNLTTTR